METTRSHDQIKVLVIDDHPIVRDNCCRICRLHPNIVTAEAGTAEQGLTANRTFFPEIIILDLALGDANGFDIMSTLLRENHGARIIIFSMYTAARFITRALDLGAHGFITKNDDPNGILTAIAKVRRGDIYFSLVAGNSLALADFGPSRDRVHDLNGLEYHVLMLLGEGKRLSEIAKELGIGYKAVARTVAKAKQKLGCSSSAALVKFAVERARWK